LLKCISDDGAALYLYRIFKTLAYWILFNGVCQLANVWSEAVTTHFHQTLAVFKDGCLKSQRTTSFLILKFEDVI